MQLLLFLSVYNTYTSVSVISMLISVYTKNYTMSLKPAKVMLGLDFMYSFRFITHCAPIGLTID